MLALVIGFTGRTVQPSGARNPRQRNRNPGRGADTGGGPGPGGTVSVAIAEGEHPVPFRTRKLSPPAPMVLRGRLRGRVGRRRDIVDEKDPDGVLLSFRLRLPSWGTEAHADTLEAMGEPNLQRELPT